MPSVVKIEDRVLLSPQVCSAVPARRSFQKLKQILVPVDLKNDCRASIHYGIWLAQRFDSTVNLIHVYEEPYVLNPIPRTRSCDVFNHHRRNVFADFYQLLEKTRHEYPKSVGFFEYGNPDRDISKLAQRLGADLLILCACSGHWLEHLVFGSHACRIAENAPCPVLVVRQKGQLDEQPRMKR